MKRGGIINFETFIAVAIILQITVCIVPIISFYSVRQLYKGTELLITSIIVQLTAMLLVFLVGNHSDLFGIIIPSLLFLLANIFAIRGFYRVNSIKTPYYDKIIIVVALFIYVGVSLLTKVDAVLMDILINSTVIYVNLKCAITLFIVRKKLNLVRMIPSLIVIFGFILIKVVNIYDLINVVNGKYEYYSQDQSLIFLGIHLALFIGFIQTNLFMIQRRSIGSLKKQQEVLEFYANYDELTNLPNRRLLVNKFDLAVKNSKKFALAMFDLDDFKFINDNYGHEIGDAILKKIGERLTNEMTDDDFIARYGGDEFIMIIQDNKEQFQIEYRLKKIIKEIAKPITINKNKISVTISMGLSVYPKDGKTIGTLRKKADTAMYKVKYEEKNNFKFFVK
ncbi:GGDEF domain-containing protein [Haploplasma axanthum]|uniref:Cyclic di-GMP phosphodiesterase Gmr n=1 Tax=Haploplasma axanthum TaxID=29552 RepID=A0A449BBW4_HAPAX|nr:GGDEF domain-containing protein [Haploplasma axanthum]VEU79926.1 Cyclic di-GMP phosphodiesterase Gmr [Haploplasma axanthum]